MANWCAVSGYVKFTREEDAERAEGWLTDSEDAHHNVPCGSTYIHGCTHTLVDNDTTLRFYGDVPWALENGDAAQFLCNLLQFGNISEFKVSYDELSSNIYGNYTYTPTIGLVDAYVPEEFYPEYPEFDSEEEEDDWRDAGGDYDMWWDALYTHGVTRPIELPNPPHNTRTDGVRSVAE